MEKLMSDVHGETDNEALAEAARLFGTTTKDETADAAIQDVAQRQRRREAFERLGKMGQAGDFDLLLDKKNYRR